MKLEKSRTLMKKIGILLVIASSVSVMVGIIAIAGGGFEIGKIASLNTVHYQVAVTAFLTGGIGMITACIFSITEGITSMAASKKIKKTEHKKEFGIIKTTTKSTDLKAA